LTELQKNCHNYVQLFYILVIDFQSLIKDFSFRKITSKHLQLFRIDECNLSTWHVTIVDIKMRLLIWLAPKAYFTSYISQISSLRNSVLAIVESNFDPFAMTSLSSTFTYVWARIRNKFELNFKFVDNWRKVMFVIIVISERN
jgi:hypothetical protein